MTSPSGEIPDGAVSGTGLEGLLNTQESEWKAMTAGNLSGGFQDAQGRFNIPGILGRLFANENQLALQWPIIQEQQNTVTDLVAAVDRMILQGRSEMYDSDNTHLISEGVVALDVIVIGSGGGGGAGKGGKIGSNGAGAGGGAGGGETHTTIPRAMIRGNELTISVGRGGYGGTGRGSAGGGGSPSKVSAITEPDGDYGEILAGGGEGGAVGVVREAMGGAGMIIGGHGGSIENGQIPPTAGGDSVSPYSLSGGGGGGGAGWNSASTNLHTQSTRGGRGGLSAGGVSGSSTPAAPSTIVATGGGGGGGGHNKNTPGQPGAVPAGGGGGGPAEEGILNEWAAGGNGANARVWVIERTG